MSLIPLADAKAHLRLGAAYPDEQVSPYLNAAELSAVEFLNRKVFVDQSALDAAVAAVPAALIAAGVTYADAIAAADEMDDPVARAAAKEAACFAYGQAQKAARDSYAGIVLNDLIAGGILLILGHLFENRQDVQAGVSSVQIPLGSQHLLQPFRIGLGV